MSNEGFAEFQEYNNTKELGVIIFIQTFFYECPARGSKA